MNHKGRHAWDAIGMHSIVTWWTQINFTSITTNHFSFQIIKFQSSLRNCPTPPTCVAIFPVNGRKSRASITSPQRVFLFLCFLLRFHKLNSRPASRSLPVLAQHCCSSQESDENEKISFISVSWTLWAEHFDERATSFVLQLFYVSLLLPSTSEFTLTAGRVPEYAKLAMIRSRKIIGDWNVSEVIRATMQWNLCIF